MPGSTPSDIQVWEAKETQCGLGEGPFHEENTGRLRFVDIVSKQVLWVDPQKGPSSLKKLNVKDCVGVTYDIEGDNENIIVGAKYGYAYMELATGALTYITQPSQLWTAEGESADKVERMRMNDGNIDAQGRFWCGMITDPAATGGGFKPEGALFCLSADGTTVRRMISGTTISNGVGWSRDGRTMYYADSPTKTIVAYDFDADAGTIANRRVWYDCAAAEGKGQYPVPDGFCQDEEDCFWVALYGGWKVVRLKDVDGKAVKIGEVKIPTRNITCPRIVDKTLWVTTAKEHDEGYGPESKKFDGDTFAVPVGVGPKKPYKWKKPKSNI